MPRERTIRSEFFKHEHLADLRPLYRLLFVGLWGHADRRGILEYRPRQLKTQILPYDECNVEEGLWELHKHGFIILYEVDGNWYIYIPKFTKYQKLHPKEKPSKLPAFTGETPSQVLRHPIKPPPLFNDSANLSTDQNPRPQGLAQNQLPATCQQPAGKTLPSLPTFPAVPSSPSLKLGEAAVVPENYASTARARESTAGPVEAPSSKRRPDPELQAFRSWDRLAACLRENICEPRFTDKGVRRILLFCKTKAKDNGFTTPPIELELNAVAVVLYLRHYCPPNTDTLDDFVGYAVKAIAKNLDEQRGSIEAYVTMASRLLREVALPSEKPAAQVISDAKKAEVEDLVKSIGNFGHPQPETS